MAKPKNLTERQKVLLDFVPKKFKGEQSVKVIYGALIYFSRCQEDRGLKVFSAGNTALQEMTSYGHSKISLALRWLESEKKIAKVERGTHFSGKSSVFTIIDNDYSPIEKNSGRMEQKNSGRMEQKNSGRMGMMDISGCMDNISNNQYVSDSGCMSKNSGRMEQKNSGHREILNIRKQDSEHRRGVDNQSLTDSEHRIENSGCMDENPEIVDANYNYNLNINYKDQQQTHAREKFENNINERLDKAACLFKEVLKRLSDAEKEIKTLKEEIQQLKQEKKQSTSTSESLNRFDRVKLNEEFGTHLETCNNKNKSITERKNALNNLLQLRDSGNLTEKQYNAVCCIEDNFNKEYSALKDYARFGKLYNDFNQQRTDKYEDAEELFRLRDSLIDNPNLEETHKKNVRKYGMDNDYAMTTAKDILQKERERLR